MRYQVSSVTRTKSEARANYNRLSRWYDVFAGSEARYRQLGVQVLQVQPWEYVLEIGFGTGTCLGEFAGQVSPEGLVVGIDISDGMAAVAYSRFSRTGLREKVALTLGDAVDLPFIKSAFDAVFLSFTLELFDTPEIPRVLHQCRRILRPEGRLGVVTLVKTAHPGFAERVYEWFHARMPVAVDCRPIQAQAELQQAGFDTVQVISEKMWGLPVEILLAKHPGD